jgi:hypothetical protein
LRSIEDSVAASAASQHNNSDIVLRGAGAMTQALNLPRRSVEHLLAQGYLKSPRKVGNRWFVSKAKLLREFCD